MKDNNINKLLTVILTSAVSGAFIGLLMSSKKEESKPKKIARESDKFLKKATDIIDEISHFLDHKSKTTKADIEATKDDMDELSEDAKGKGRDLVKRAKRLLSYDK
jgi:gas vesicle protein